MLWGGGQADTADDARKLAEKIAGLRVFNDADGKMNLSLAETRGAMLIVSQFTLYGDCRKGRRPSFVDAAPPELAERLYQEFVAAARLVCLQVETGEFRAQMDVSLVNDGPVTLILE